jgi:hypothetical protein
MQHGIEGFEGTIVAPDIDDKSLPFIQSVGE